MVKINSKTLLDFIKKVTINGSITDGLLKFGPEGLSLTMKDITMTGAVTGLLKAGNFTEYSQMTIPIKNMAMFIGVLSTMSGTIELTRRGTNVLHISSSSNNGDLIIPEEQYLECNLAELPILSHDGGFELDSMIWNTVKKNTQLLGTTKIGVTIEVRDGTLFIRTGEDNFDKLYASVPVDYKNVTSRYGCTLLEFISVITGKVNVAFNEDYPILITSRGQDSIIKWMVSPIIDPESSTDNEEEVVET